KWQDPVSPAADRESRHVEDAQKLVRLIALFDDGLAVSCADLCAETAHDPLKTLIAPEVERMRRQQYGLIGNLPLFDFAADLYHIQRQDPFQHGAGEGFVHFN